MSNILKDIKNNDKLLEKLLKENYDFDEDTVKMIIECFDDKRMLKDDLDCLMLSNKKIAAINDLKDKKFELEIGKFINYVKKEVDNNVSSLLYLSRFGNKIRYGKYSMGVKSESGSFFADNNSVLSVMYLALKKEFGPKFVNRGRHSLFFNYYLLPEIGDKVTIEISSNKKYDQDWFYEELFYDLHKEYNRELLRRNILYMMSSNDYNELDKMLVKRKKPKE